jgi:hypothetical protein
VSASHCPRTSARCCRTWPLPWLLPTAAAASAPALLRDGRGTCTGTAQGQRWHRGPIAAIVVPLYCASAADRQCSLGRRKAAARAPQWPHCLVSRRCKRVFVLCLFFRFKDVPMAVRLFGCSFVCVFVCSFVAQEQECIALCALVRRDQIPRPKAPFLAVQYYVAYARRRVLVLSASRDCS